MYKRIKDETNLIAKWKLKAGKKHYFHVFLWPDQKSFILNTLDNNEFKPQIDEAFIMSDMYKDWKAPKIRFCPWCGGK